MFIKPSCKENALCAHFISKSLGVISARPVADKKKTQTGFELLSSTRTTKILAVFVLTKNSDRMFACKASDDWGVWASGLVQEMSQNTLIFQRTLPTPFFKVTSAVPTV